jgi:hypothetical protein
MCLPAFCQPEKDSSGHKSAVVFDKTHHYADEPSSMDELQRRRIEYHGAIYPHTTIIVGIQIDGRVSFIIRLEGTSAKT